MTLHYERDPGAIYAASFATIRAEAPIDRLAPDLQPLAIRLIHACGMVDLIEDFEASGDVVACAHSAIEAGKPILCDTKMVASGIIASRLCGNEIVCTLDDERVPGLAIREGTTRTAAAVELWRHRVEGAVVVIGNAPTALFHLLACLDDGWPKPAAILAFPVGFVGAAESKAELAANPRGVPFATVHGRRGGSAMAAAAVNAVSAGLVEETAR
ncbi:precorrin-8X methylmutase [Breoghania corrubedonensis]|uniref:Precorrin-8X methylmutase n=1 Tax=Breoghania corrubedonensis TaxID=665038 RepID=A0A2T5VFY5_9HYPH|nr:precorrin-8X methylmutase [Breoghania corrubedonensis]PTW62669.1 precorrin-8X methylmutase [Breoghania corrubedonensis]